MIELESIEMKLHNLPKIEGCEICHSHCGEWIVFSAWKGAERVSPRSLRVHIKTIEKNPLEDYREDFRWLVKGEKE